MEMVAVPEVWARKEKNKTLALNVFFRAKYTEINQEKERKKIFDYLKKILLFIGIYMGESVGECWWLHWFFPWNITDAATTNH